MERVYGPDRQISCVFYLVVVLILFALVYSKPPYSLAQSSTPWQTLETKHSVIHYRSLQDLMKLRRKLRYGPGSGTFFGLFSSEDPEQGASEIAAKVDAVFERVQQILGMRKAMTPVTINLYPNRAQLCQAYRQIYGTECRIRAWYRFRDKTIYLNVKDLHEGILAHEMAHFIIDNYLDVRPPRATAEILARYVDIHLKD